MPWENKFSPEKSHKKIGVFGGTFDPLHYGHINSMLTVMRELELDVIKVVPAYQSPHRQKQEGPGPQQRFEMVERGLSQYKDIFHVLDLELRRGGLSYTVETLKKLRQDLPDDEFYLIVGMDQFQVFDQWKDYKTLLELANLVVTSRPGFPWIAETPEGVRELIDERDDDTAHLKTGRWLHFIRLDDVDISATDLRKRLRSGMRTTDLIPPEADAYIRKQNLYKTSKESVGNFEKLTHFCAGILENKSGIQVKAFDLRELDQPSEFTVIASGTSTRHTVALSDYVLRAVKETYGYAPQSVEGQEEGHWIVQDYGALIVHIFYDYTRQYYQLEELWQKGFALQRPAE